MYRKRQSWPRILLASILVFVSLTSQIVPTALASYNQPSKECAEVLDSFGTVLADPHCALVEFFNLVMVFLNVAIPFAAVASLAFLLIGGLGYIMAGPNPDRVASARGTLTWAVVGLIITLHAWLIMRLIARGFGNIPGL